MVGDILQPTHLLFILLVALLVLGPKRLPEVGRTLGSGLRDFRNALSGDHDEDRYEQHHEPAPIEQPHRPAAEPDPEAAVGAASAASTASQPAAAQAAPAATAAQTVTRTEPAPEPATIQPLALGDSSASDTQTEPDA